MADPSGPAAVLESEGITTSRPEHEDIPEDDWAEANEDGATGTEEEEADAESYDTEDEDPIDDEVCSIPSAAWRPCWTYPHRRLRLPQGLCSKKTPALMDLTCAGNVASTQSLHGLDRASTMALQIIADP